MSIEPGGDPQRRVLLGAVAAGWQTCFDEPLPADLQRLAERLSAHQLRLVAQAIYAGLQGSRRTREAKARYRRALYQAASAGGTISVAEEPDD